MPITATMLYDFIQCPHRVQLDLFGNPTKRDPVSPFVQLLWERGSAFEAETIAGLQQPFLDLSGYTGSEKETATRAAMERGEPLIYSGRITHKDLVGEPDLLRRHDGGYVAGDIKSGSGEEGGSEDEEDGKPKRHYAVQVSLYTDILEGVGRSAGRHAFIWDIHGREVAYDLTSPIGVRDRRTLWDVYVETLASVREITNQTQTTLPAYSSGVCKNCVWYSACSQALEAADDLTLIPELGRAKRDEMLDQVETIRAFAAADPAAFINGKKTQFRGIGPDTLLKLHARAQLLANADPRPYLRAPVTLPVAKRELFFDIEADPMRDICYLHGFVERTAAGERYVAFFADQPSRDAERLAFADAVAFMQAAHPCVTYYYSKYERTYYRKLRARYPDVCTEAEIEALFDPTHCIDLFSDVVRKATEWPTKDHSIKTLARYLGFQWRDTHPSGAASIEWFHRWTETRDLSIRQRILDYNEDDCRATRVLLDAVRILKL